MLENLALGSLAPDNCALAVTAARLALAQLGKAADPERFTARLAEVRLPGRMEQHEHQGIRVILDVAHNPAAASFLARELSIRWPAKRYVAIYGALADKDAPGVLDELKDLVQHWLLIPTRGWRAQRAETLSTQIDPIRQAETCSSFADALDRARSLTEPGNGILVFGSFSAVEQARELLIDPTPSAASATKVT